MKNVEYVVKDGKLIISIDLSVKCGLSNSGKSIVIATTEGNMIIPEAGVTLGLNCYVKNKK